MSKVLVTGAGGFIGKKIALHFVRNGYEVVGWDTFSDNAVFPMLELNMSKFEDVTQALEELKPDIIIHCAGSADVGKSIEDPEVDFLGNVTLTHNLLFAMHKCGLEKLRFVFLSSASVYGNPRSLPITEEMELNPLSPYAVHKVMCEELCKYFINNYGADIKIARIFSAYGVGLKKQIFWDMYNKSKTGKLSMFGTGSESRDYIHINDVVYALYLLATTTSDDVIFNVANGEEVTIREATEIFAKASNIELNNIVFNGVVREGDPLNWRADITKISELGYKKSISVQEGINEYSKWVRGGCDAR